MPILSPSYLRHAKKKWKKRSRGHRSPLLLPPPPLELRWGSNWTLWSFNVRYIHSRGSPGLLVIVAAIIKAISAEVSLFMIPLDPCGNSTDQRGGWGLKWFFYAFSRGHSRKSWWLAVQWVWLLQRGTLWVLERLLQPLQTGGLSLLPAPNVSEEGEKALN